MDGDVMASLFRPWADEVVEGFLFLGSVNDAKEKEQMQVRGITHVLNCADDVDNFHPKHFEYMRLDVKDQGEDEGISRTFEAAFAFLERVEQEGGRVLVHCLAGINRSPTIVIAYLVHSRRIPLIEAVKIVKSKRRRIKPLVDNQVELLRFELTALQQNSLTEDDLAILTWGYPRPKRIQ